VVPALYHAVKSFGSGPVRDVFTIPTIPPHDQAYHPIAAAYEMLRDKNPGQMVAITHWRNGAWARRYRPGAKGVIIPKNMIWEEYRARTSVQ
jgi:hypothetical protein